MSRVRVATSPSTSSRQCRYASGVVAKETSGACSSPGGSDGSLIPGPPVVAARSGRDTSCGSTRHSTTLTLSVNDLWNVWSARREVQRGDRPGVREHVAVVHGVILPSLGRRGPTAGCDGRTAEPPTGVARLVVEWGPWVTSACGP